MKKVFFSIFFIFSFWLVPLDSVVALTITPARQTAIIDPGSTQSVRLIVKNDEKEPVKVTGTVEGFRIEEKTHRAVFGVNDEALSWLKINPKEVVLGPGETKDIFFTVSVPKSALPQVHYIALFAEVQSQGGQVGISSRVGSLFFLYVSGDIREEINILNFSSGRSWYSQSDSSIFFQVKNDGTIHTIPKGKITLKDWRGNRISEFFVNIDNHLVLPGSEWSESYDVDLKPWHIGKIEVIGNFTYGIEQKMLLRKIEFWYVPVWSIGIVIFLFFIFLTLCIRIGTRKNRKRE